jgi:acyl carrier protein
MDPFIEALKVKIIETLALEDVTPEDIDPEAQLVGGDLGIDSIDVLELVMLVEKEYGVVIDSKELGAQVFASLGPWGRISKKCKKGWSGWLIDGYSLPAWALSARWGTGLRKPWRPCKRPPAAFVP